MSDYICLEIQAEIMKRLPVKSLIRFRLVSKQWKALIESSEFVSDYSLHSTQQQKHLFVTYFDHYSLKDRYVSIADDDTFPLRKFSVTVPVSLALIDNSQIVTSQGLFCLYDFYQNSSINRKNTRVVIWNPLITKTVDIDVPNVLDKPYENVIGFSVSPKTTNIKLVKIAYCRCIHGSDILPSFPWQVMVYSLSSKVWRNPLCSKLPRNSIRLASNQVDFDGVVYWCAYDTVLVDDELKRFNMIMSFNMTSEEFAQVCLPDSLVHSRSTDLDISKLRESLVVFEYNREVEKRVCNVWMMEHGVPESFTKLFTINMTDTSVDRVLGFRTSGELVTLMMKIDSYDRCGELFVYEPYLQNIRAIGIYGKRFPFSANSYPETLLLLDH